MCPSVPIVSHCVAGLLNRVEIGAVRGKIWMKMEAHIRPSSDSPEDCVRAVLNWEVFG